MDMTWRYSAQSLPFVSCMVRPWRIGLWTFLTLSFTLPSFSWRVFSFRDLPLDSGQSLQPQIGPMFRAVSMRPSPEKTLRWGSRNMNRDLKSTVWKSVMSSRSKHRMESKATTHSPYWRDRLRTQLRLRGTGLKPRRRTALYCRSVQSDLVPICEGECAAEHGRATPCSACWHGTGDIGIGDNATLSGPAGDEHYFFLGLEGQDCSEYYGTEDPRPYTEDGEFWFFEPRFDEILDRWDTYDARCTEGDCCEDCIFAMKTGFRIPRTFDWNATTSNNYAAPAGDFAGPFAAHRAEMDYTYHVNYVPARQRLQDEIVGAWVDLGVTAERPWIIFTAGAMGAGKSYMLERLVEQGCHVLAAMVRVDPDAVKYQLPEMNEYIRRNPGPRPSNRLILAGAATHNESGFVQELIVRELMDRRMHLVVDGSLSNADWYAEYFRHIRRRYPEYRIGIMHVVCDPADLWTRVQQRCLQTGRCIGHKTVELSLQLTPVAVKRLSPLADFVAVVDSSAEEMVELRCGPDLLFGPDSDGGCQSPSREGVARLQRLLQA